MIFPADTLVEIYESEGRVVEIDWPEAKVLPTPGHVYSVQSSRRAGKTKITVHRSLAAGMRAEIQLDSAIDRPVFLGKSGGYTTRPSHAISAHLAISEGERYEPEPEALSGPETAEMARRARLDRIERTRARLSDLYEQLADLQDDPDFSKHKGDVKFLRSLTHKLEAALARDDAHYLSDLQEAS